MNKIKYIFALFTICFSTILVSCQTANTNLDDDFQFVPDSLDVYTLSLPEYYFDLCIDEDCIYLLGNDNILQYSGVSGAMEQFSSETGAAIAAYNGEIAILQDNAILIIDQTGKKKEAFPLYINDITQWSDIIVNEKYIVFTGYSTEFGYIKNRIFVINRKNDNISELTSANEDKSVFAITGIDFLNSDQIAIVSKITLDFFNDNNILTVVNILSDNVEYETPLPYATQISCVSESIYYSNDMRVCLYRQEENTSTTIRNYKESYLSESLGLDVKLLGCKLYVTSSNIIYLFPSTNLLYVDRLAYKNEPVRIIVPNSERFYEKYENEILQFTTETRTQVEVRELPDENYTQKINFMLTSADKSFDYYLLTDVNHSHTLRGILEKKMYHSLSNSELVEGLLSQMIDGVRDISTYKNDIYGMPLEFAYIPLRINREVFEKYGLEVPKESFTYDDIWKLCEQLKNLKLDVRVFSDSIDVLGNIIRDWGENHYDNQEILSYMIQKYLLYMQNGVLSFDSNNKGEYLFETFHDYIIPYYDKSNSDLIASPKIQATDSNIGRLASVLLMNPTVSESKRIDVFLTYLYKNERFKLYYNSEDIYSNIDIKLQPDLTMNTAVIDSVLNKIFNSTYEMSSSEICDIIISTADYMING